MTSTTSSSQADSYYENGLKHFEQGDYDKAFTDFKKGAKKKDAKSQYYVGYMTGRGLGTKQDIKDSFYWYKKSAENGYYDAQFRMCIAYKFGKYGVEKDYDKALYWALEGRGDTQEDKTGNMGYISGQIYEEGGYGVDRNYTWANYYYLASADQGNINSLFKAGLYYLGGEVIAVDYKKAFEYFSLAINKGLRERWLFYHYGELYENGHGVDQDYSKARYWYNKAMKEPGFTKAPYRMGKLYYYGQGVEKNYKTALIFFKKSIGYQDNSTSDWVSEFLEANISDAFMFIAKIYRKGEYGAIKHLKEASYWFSIAFENKHFEAADQLGLLYFSDSYGVERDFKTSLEWFKKGEKMGNKYSSFFAGMVLCYLGSDGDKIKFDEGISLVRKAAENNYSIAHISLGLFFEKGFGVKKDYNKAMSIYKFCSRYGNIPAGFANMGWLYYKGLGVAKDHNKAHEMYQRSMEIVGNNFERGFALNGLGLLYQDGIAFTQSHSTAMKYFLEAVKLKSPHGCNSMGNIYKYGYGGTHINNRTAQMWYAKSNFFCSEFIYGVCDEGWLNFGKSFLDQSEKTVLVAALALEYLKRALKYGNHEAQIYIDQAMEIKRNLEPH